MVLVMGSLAVTSEHGAALVGVSSLSEKYSFGKVQAQSNRCNIFFLREVLGCLLRAKFGHKKFYPRVGSDGPVWYLILFKCMYQHIHLKYICVLANMEGLYAIDRPVITLGPSLLMHHGLQI